MARLLPEPPRAWLPVVAGLVVAASRVGGRLDIALIAAGLAVVGLWRLLGTEDDR